MNRTERPPNASSAACQRARRPFPENSRQLNFKSWVAALSGARRRRTATGRSRGITTRHGPSQPEWGRKRFCAGRGPRRKRDWLRVLEVPVPLSPRHSFTCLGSYSASSMRTGPSMTGLIRETRVFISSSFVCKTSSLRTSGGRQGLEEASCECYRAVTREFERLFA
jgi:hypothetical protein